MGQWVVHDYSTYAFKDVYFTDKFNGYFVGTSDVIKTTDSGGTLVSVSSTTGDIMNSIFFINDSLGWIAANNGKIARTTDGGTSWTSMTTGTANILLDIHFADAAHGWAVGHGSMNGGTK